MNIETSTLMKELADRGIEDVGVEKIYITKNAVPCTGIRIVRFGQEEVSPVIYYSPQDTVAQIADRVIQALEQESPDLDLKKLYDPEYFAGHSFIAVSRRNGEGSSVVTKPYLNLDVVLKMTVNGMVTDREVGTVKVTQELLREIGISEKDAWDLAEANSYAAASVKSMSEVLLGIPDEEGMEAPMMIATVNGGHNGAAAICFTEIFRQYCLDKDLSSLIILPSSTEELIFIPESDFPDTDGLLEMVRSINASEVQDLLQLTPAVYRYTYSDNSISVVAALEEEA